MITCYFDDKRVNEDSFVFLEYRNQTELVHHRNDCNYRVLYLKFFRFCVLSLSTYEVQISLNLILRKTDVCALGNCLCSSFH